MVTLIQYIEPDELAEVKGRLDGSGIKYIVTGHHSRGRGENAYYEVKVVEEDFQRAKVIANKYRVKEFIKSKQCPKCQSMLSEPVTDLNFFQRILYWGTTPVRCKKCKTRFVV